MSTPASASHLWLAFLCGLGGLWSSQCHGEKMSGPHIDTKSVFSWRSIGPDRGGRVTAVAGFTQQPLRFLAGTSGGGVIETRNGGHSWHGISTRTFGSSSVGAIAIAAQNPDLIYVGMGESTQRTYMSSLGDGVYRSSDGGTSWTHLGLEESRRIGAIVIDPRDANRVFVASMGNPWKPSKDRGVILTSDGGQHWRQVLFINDTTSAADLSMDPHDANTLYAAMWDNIRSPWYLRSGGAGSGLYKSTDGGVTWRRLERGLPRSIGKIGVAVSPADSHRVYAIVESTEELGGLYASTDGGETWEKKTGMRDLWYRPWYYMHVRPDPVRADRVWVLCTNAWRSDDGGVNFRKMVTPSDDNHALWINPNSPDTMVEGSDGGASVTVDGGESWSSLFNQRTGQFFRVSIDARTPYTVFGSQQDWGSVALRSRPELGGAAGAFAFEVGGGEAGYIVPDPFDPDLIFAGSELGYITRFDRRSGTATPINAYPLFPEGTNPRLLKFRFDVNAPIVASRHVRGTIYHAAQVVLRSKDRGQSWEPISPDLTRNERGRQEAGAGPFTNERISAYNVISSLDESPLDGSILWAGTDDGRIEVTLDGGRNWADRTPLGVHDGEFYTIAASPSSPAAAYAALTRHRLGDMRPYLFKTSNYGRSWQVVSAGLPQDIYARVIREDSESPGILYAGTERAVYVSLDQGTTWQEFGAETLPTTPITGIVVYGNDLVISTEGTGIWILSGLATLRQLKAHDPSDPSLHLYQPADAYVTEGMPQGLLTPTEELEDAKGAAIDFSLPSGISTQSSNVSIRMTDASGGLIRTLWPDSSTRESSTDNVQVSLHDGLNRVYWDLRKDPLSARIDVAFDGTLAGARVPPGNYYVHLRLGNLEQSQALHVVWNPSREAPPPGAIAEKQALLARIEVLFADVASDWNSFSARHPQLQLPSSPHEATSAGLLWERLIFDRRLTGAQSRVNYGGGLLFDIATLHTMVDTAQSPIGGAMVDTCGVLEQRWREIKRAQPP